MPSCLKTDARSVTTQDGEDRAEIKHQKSENDHGSDMIAESFNFIQRRVNLHSAGFQFQPRGRATRNRGQGSPVRREEVSKTASNIARPAPNAEAFTSKRPIQKTVVPGCHFLEHSHFLM
jgi:hypothetical protein